MKLRDELVQYYRWLRQYGLNDSHSGNVSVRNGDKVWITPTGACADTLVPAELIKCRMHRPPTEGASLDAALHLAVYARNPKAQVLIHSHVPYTVALTLRGGDFIPLDFEGQHYFKRIAVIDIPYAEYVSQAPALVADALTSLSLVVVRGHGLYVQAETLNLAYKWSCSVELSAKIALLAQTRNMGQLPES